jgi:glycerate 2-kinase
MNSSMVDDAKIIYQSAVKSILPDRLINSVVKFNGSTLQVGCHDFQITYKNRIFVVGAGKAAAAMAKAIETVLEDRIFKGTVITKYGHSVSLKRITVLEASHPVPDKNGLEATIQMLKATENLTETDVILFLLSGGASSLLIDVPPGAELNDVIELYDQLLKSGASIHQFNIVRKQLSCIKGGGLLRHFFPAIVISLIISDVPGDEYSIIGSGPTITDNSSAMEARQILLDLGLWKELHPSLKDTIVNKIEKFKKDNEFNLAHNTYNFLLANNQMALKVAATKANELGYNTYVHPVVLEGDTNEVANRILHFVYRSVKKGKCCFLFGSETTVKVTGKGKGGRCQQMVLAAYVHLQNCTDNLVFFAAGTDGQDGPTEVAGAVIDLASMGTNDLIAVNKMKYLMNNDSYHFFQKNGGHIVTGPTYTNVMDIVIVLLNK